MIVKIWPIKMGNSGSYSLQSKGLNASLAYIMDDEKVICSDDYVLDENELADREVRRVLQYGSDENKTEKKFISGYLCDPENAAEQFAISRIGTKYESGRLSHKERAGGAIAFHIVQSFPIDLEISDEEVHECGIDLCKKIGLHQAVICSHIHPVKGEDGLWHGRQKHNHILLNAYVDPRKLDLAKPNQMKYHDCKESYAQLRIWNDEVALEHDLPIIRDPGKDSPSWYESYNIRKGDSWKELIRRDIDAAKNRSTNWAEFEAYMTNLGYVIKDGQYTTYTTSDGVHKARCRTLGEAYNKKQIEQFIAEQNYYREEIEREVQENRTPELTEFVSQSEEQLTVALPLGRTKEGSPNYYYLPIANTSVDKKALESYFGEKELYDICDEEGNFKGAYTGLEILQSMEKLRNGFNYDIQKEEHRKKEKEAINKAKKTGYYMWEPFVNSRTYYPYRTSLYDKYGRKRSLLELIFLLAIVVIKGESKFLDYDEPHVNSDNVLAFAPINWKIQNMLDSISLSRELGIETPAEVDRRLETAGKTLSHVRSAHNKVLHSKERMDLIQKAILDYKNTKGIAEMILAEENAETRGEMEIKHEEKLFQYIAAKKILDERRINNELQMADFESRYNKITADIKDLKSRVDDAKAEYRKLKKIQKAQTYAQYEQYCYGPNYTYESFQKHREEQMDRADDKKHDLMAIINGAAARSKLENKNSNQARGEMER